MKKGISSVVWLACPFVLAAAAAAARTAPPRVAVIGCIRRAEPSLERAPGTPTQTKYLLTNITLAEDPAAAADRPGSLISESVNLYRLDDSAVELIASHVGDRVEVTGVVIGASDSATGRAAKPDEKPRDVKTPTLKVQSVRTISSRSATCSP